MQCGSQPQSQTFNDSSGSYASTLSIPDPNLTHFTWFLPLIHCGPLLRNASVSLGAVAWVSITGDLELETMALSGGAQLVVAGSPSKLSVHSVTDDNTGLLYVSPTIKLQINSVFSPCAKIFQGAELILSDRNQNVTLERSVSVYGTLSVDGAPSVFLGKHQGVFTMHSGSSPSTLAFGELIVETSGHLRLLNHNDQQPETCRWSLVTSGTGLTLKDGSKMEVSCPLNITGDKMTTGVSSALKIYGNGSISYVSMNDVLISGTFHPGVLSVLGGWKNLRIERYGEMRFLPYGDLRIDELYSNGKLLVEGAVYVRGRDPAVTHSITIGQFGRVEFGLPLSSNSLSFVQDDTQRFGLNGSLTLNGTSVVHADFVVVDGTWLPKKLKIDPGWKELTVEDDGHFHFDPVNIFHLNKFRLDGDVKFLSAVKMKGLFQERVVQCEVGPHGKVSIESVDLTTIACQSVLISGTLRVGNLSLASSWDDLQVNGSNGKFYFEISEAMNITHTRVSGLLETRSPIGQNAPFSGESFVVESSGRVSIHYQAQPTVIADGAVNSTFHVTNVDISGSFYLGSLFLFAENFTVYPSGLVSVDGGGALGGEGPGRGSQANDGGSGASHGGRGGRGSLTRAQSLPYGDIFSPGGWGSGGGSGIGNSGGGRGGGRIFLQIKKHWKVDGRVRMNGLPGQVSR